MAVGILAGSYGKSNSFGFTLIDPLEELAREERLFVSHKKFIQETQSVTGEPHRRLNAYPFINVPYTKSNTKGIVTPFYKNNTHYATNPGAIICQTRIYLTTLFFIQSSIFFSVLFAFWV